jgi:pectin methylesterase-like acyl-CoA thioesterase
MPKRRASSWRGAVGALLLAPLALAGCGDSGSGPAPGADASLRALSLSAGTLNPTPFTPETTSYFLVLPYGTPSFTVTPTATDPAATIAVKQDTAAGGGVASGAASAALATPAIGARSVVTVTVTAADGRTTRTYGLLVTQFVSHDAALSGLATDVGAWTPAAFAAGTTSYAVLLTTGTAAVSLTATANDPAATLTLTDGSAAAVAMASGVATPVTVPAAGGTATLAVKVTAQDGTTTRTYTLTLSQQAANDANLALLTDNAHGPGGSVPGFSAATTSYPYWVPYQSGHFTVTPTSSDAHATVRVNGAVVARGAPSAPIALSESGTTPIAIVVTAQDGATTKTYDLTVTQGPKAGLVTPRTVPTGASALLPVAAGATLPATGAAGVPVDTLLRIGFDAAPTLGTAGMIRICAAGTDCTTPVDRIELADPYAIYDGTSTIKALSTNQASTKVNVLGGVTSGIDQVRVVNYVPVLISGNTAVIVPHNNKLAYGSQYYVLVDPGVFSGAVSGAAFAGITSPTAWTFTVKASAPTTYAVAADNSADFATVQGAIDAVPYNNASPVTISVAPGVYQELLWIRKKKITLQGTDGVNTVIQYDNCDGFNPGTGGGQAVATPGASGTLPAGNLAGGGRSVLLMSSATPIVLDTLTLKNLHGQGSLVIPTLPAPTTVTRTVSPTYVNYSSAVTQAETLYFNVDFGTGTPLVEPGNLVARHANFVSYQDTIQVKGWSWFYDCFITGDVDFIWGNANGALFERSEIKSRSNGNGAAVVQSRAYLNYVLTSAAALDTHRSYPGFVFLNCALTKEDGSFTAYLARSPGATNTGTKGSFTTYGQFDSVSFIDCSMDSHIAALGWNVVGGNPGGANVAPSPVAGWREYRSFTPAGQIIDTSGRLADPAPAQYYNGSFAANTAGSRQLTDAQVGTFFPSRATLFGGATDGTYTTSGAGAFSPVP